MKRWAFNILAVLSLLLCVATLLMGVVGGWASWERIWWVASDYAPAGDSVRIQVVRGIVTLRMDGSSRDGVPRGIVLTESRTWDGRLFMSSEDQQPPFRWEYEHRAQSYLLNASIPLGMFSLLFAIPPATWAWRRHSAPEPGLCAECRYNLTGNTSGVCPECGTAVAGKAEGVA